MTHTRFLKTAVGITAFTANILAGTMKSSKRVSARDDETGDHTEESRIQRGFDIAPKMIQSFGISPENQKSTPTSCFAEPIVSAMVNFDEGLSTKSHSALPTMKLHSARTSSISS